jgi:hypothetical protein
MAVRDIQPRKHVAKNATYRIVDIELRVRDSDGEWFMTANGESGTQGAYMRGDSAEALKYHITRVYERLEEFVDASAAAQPAIES